MKFNHAVFVILLGLIPVGTLAENVADGFAYIPDINASKMILVVAMVGTVEGESKTVNTWWMGNVGTDSREHSDNSLLYSPQTAPTMKTARGDFVISGYFYVDGTQTSWGNPNNPDLYIKVWHDASGRIDVNCFHVSVPDIACSAALGNPTTGSFDENSMEVGVATMSNRYVRLTLEPGSSKFVLK
jgi:hypothetical protein